MLAFSKRFINTLSDKIQQIIPGNSPESRLFIDFSKITRTQIHELFDIEKPASETKKLPINIKSESSYNAYLSDSSLELGVKKQNCIAWIQIPGFEFQDNVIKAKFRLDSMGSYAAAGIVFRVMDEDSYYMALISNKGYFRLDIVKNNSPKSLIAWTEISDFEKTQKNGISCINLGIITYGSYLIFVVNDKWLGEVNDDKIAVGEVGFALASYEDNASNEDKDFYEENKFYEDEHNQSTQNDYTCMAYFDYLSVDTRIKSIEDNYKKWTDDNNINAESRLRLAETFAVMGEPYKALDQINRAWKRRDEAISSVTTTYSQVRTRKELLLAARMSFLLGQYNEADEYIDMILEQHHGSAEAKIAYTEKLRILNEQKKYPQLKEFILNNMSKINKDIDYYTMLAACHWNLKEYSECALAWDSAFKLNNENGVYAVNAAASYEIAGNKKEALTRYIGAGKLFLNQENTAELAAMIPKLMLLGNKNWEARSLIGKWAFSMEDYEKCVKEFEEADKLRRSQKPQPQADPAIYYLWGLVFYIEGKIKQAVRMLEKAVKLAPDYKLFQDKLEEIKAKSNEDN